MTVVFIVAGVFASIAAYAAIGGVMYAVVLKAFPDMPEEDLWNVDQGDLAQACFVWPVSAPVLAAGLLGIVVARKLLAPKLPKAIANKETP